MKERAVEEFLLGMARGAAGVALKLSPTGEAGWPDRLILLPRARMAFIELKRPGEAPTPLQLHRLDTLRGLGFRAMWTDSHAELQRYVRGLAQ